MSVGDKVVVITGATRGIGRAVALQCAREGASVVVSGRKTAGVDAVVESIISAGGSAVGLPVDVTDYVAVESLRDSTIQHFGRIDVWFNNAGVSLGYRPLDEIDASELERLVAVNLTGHINGCRAILPYFRQHGGYLMNMAGRGYRGEATPHTAAYAATKTAIASLTRSLAAENGDVANISVNALVPGMVLTDFYVDMRTSPRLESTKDNWRFAMNAFGVPIDVVAEKTAEFLGEEPGKRTGKILSLLTPRRMLRGSALMAWYGMSGRLARG